MIYDNYKLYWTDLLSHLDTFGMASIGHRFASMHATRWRPIVGPTTSTCCASTSFKSPTSRTGTAVEARAFGQMRAGMAYVMGCEDEDKDGGEVKLKGEKGC